LFWFFIQTVNQPSDRKRLNRYIIFKPNEKFEYFNTKSLSYTPGITDTCLSIVRIYLNLVLKIT
jgi:hypothetical protein